MDVTRIGGRSAEARPDYKLLATRLGAFAFFAVWVLMAWTPPAQSADPGAVFEGLLSLIPVALVGGIATECLFPNAVSFGDTAAPR